MIHIVVTGANGFIGNNILERLLKIDPTQLGYPAAPTPHFSTFEEHPNQWISITTTDLPHTLSTPNANRFAGSARVRYVDYENLFQDLERLEKPPTLIIHNGACSSTTESDPAVFQKLNLSYSQKVWDYCARQRVPLIYASSAATYGDGTLGFSDKKEDCHRYTSLNLYGKSKLDFDLWALKQANTPPTWFGLRYFNVYGPFESHKGGQASMVYHGYNQAKANGVIRLFQSNTPQYKDGEQLRDFVFIDDVVDITVKLAKLCVLRQDNPAACPLPENGLFLNVGTGTTQTWNTLAQCVFSAMSLPTNIHYIPIPPNIANQYQNYTCAKLDSWALFGLEHTFRTLPQGVTSYVHKHLLRGL